MKGALGLIVIAAVVWVFWMTYVWLRKPKNNNPKNNDRP